MAQGVNKVILIGNLGAVPDIRFTQSQKQVANLSIATSESWTDKQTGQKQEKTEWHRVIFFDRLAEIAGQYLKKGSKVYVEGKLQTRKWQDQQGIDRYTTEIVGGQMQMLDSPQHGGYQQPAQQAPQGGYQQQPQQGHQQGYSHPAPQQQRAPAQQPQTGYQNPPPSQRPEYQAPQQGAQNQNFPNPPPHQ